MAIGEARDDTGDYEVEQTVVIETNIDDMNPQMYDYLIGLLLDQGALDVFLTSVQMKKNRPGTLLSVICLPDAVGTVCGYPHEGDNDHRVALAGGKSHQGQATDREIDTRHGPIHIKLARNNGRIINLTPEYDDCKRVAAGKEDPAKKGDG